MSYIGDIVGDAKNSKKKEFQNSEVGDRSVALSTFEKYLVPIFGAQWWRYA